MNIKRILLVSVSIIVVLTVVLGAAGFILASNTPAKADEALSEAQITFDNQAIYEANVAETKDSAPGYKDDSSSDFGCDHDQAIDWYAED